MSSQPGSSGRGGVRRPGVIGLSGNPVYNAPSNDDPSTKKKSKTYWRNKKGESVVGVKRTKTGESGRTHRYEFQVESKDGVTRDAHVKGLKMDMGPGKKRSEEGMGNESGRKGKSIVGGVLGKMNGKGKEKRKGKGKSCAVM